MRCVCIMPFQMAVEQRPLALYESMRNCVLCIFKCFSEIFFKLCLSMQQFWSIFDRITVHSRFELPQASLDSWLRESLELRDLWGHSTVEPGGPLIWRGQLTFKTPCPCNSNECVCSSRLVRTKKDFFNSFLLQLTQR